MTNAAEKEGYISVYVARKRESATELLILLGSKGLSPLPLFETTTAQQHMVETYEMEIGVPAEVADEARTIIEEWQLSKAAKIKSISAEFEKVFGVGVLVAVAAGIISSCIWGFNVGWKLAFLGGAMGMGIFASMTKNETIPGYRELFIVTEYEEAEGLIALLKEYKIDAIIMNDPGSFRYHEPPAVYYIAVSEEQVDRARNFIAMLELKNKVEQN